MIDAFLLAILAGATGGLVVGVPAALARRGRRVVPLELGQRIAEPDGREWRVVGRSFDVQAGRPASLRVDLVLDEDRDLERRG